MAVKKIPEFEFGGVDSRSNPANYPPNRFLRCRNFIITQAGQLRLRYGYTKPIQTGGSGEPIHSAAYFETYAGGKFVLFGQGTHLKKYDIATGVISTITIDSGVLGFTPGSPAEPFATTVPWGYFRSANKIYIGNPDAIFMFSYDGAKLRIAGVPVVGGFYYTPLPVITVVPGAGTWLQTTLSGYEIWIVLYNPITGQVGNRVRLVPSKVTVASDNSSVQITGLHDLSATGGFDPEWVIGFGRTADNGEVPYWLVDVNGNRVTAPATQTSVTLTDGTIDATQELPFRNGMPPIDTTIGNIGVFDKFAKVSTKIFAAKKGNVNLRYAEDDTDSSNGDFVGVPAESWPPDNFYPFPTAEVPTAIHAYRFEGWFFSQNTLAIWSNFLFQQGVNPWRGPWPTGCAGQKAFIETPYGPYWVTPDKQLMAYTAGGPVPQSEEYEASLLAKIGDQYVSQIELAYYRNAELFIDRLYIRSFDRNGAPVLIIHDFRIKDFRSQVGQGYEYIYSGMVPQTFIGSGYTPRQNFRDLNGREKLWVGATDGNFYQLEDGISDNAGTYTGDAIGLINLGENRPLVDGIEWQGDGNVKVSWSTQTILGLNDFKASTTKKADSLNNPNNVWQASIGKEARWAYVRFLLDSHPTDGNFDVTDPPNVPMPSYGVINMLSPMLGRERPEAK